MAEPDGLDGNTSSDVPVAMAQVISTEPPPVVTGCPFAHPRQPPLCIAHLLAWMVTTGLFLGLGRVLLSSWATIDFEIPAWYRLLFQAEQVLSAPLYGAALLGVLFVAWRWVRNGPQFPSQPGHWLMLIYGVTTVYTWCFCIGKVVLIPEIWNEPAAADFASGMHSVLGYLVGAIVCSVAGWRLRDQWYWKLDFKVCALLQFSLAAILFLLLAGGEMLWWQGRVWVERWSLYQTVCFATVLLVIAIFEVRQRYARDWLHWVGVALGLLMPAAGFLDILAQRMLARM